MTMVVAMERTSEQHRVSNACARFGPEHFVSKVGRGWVVEVAGYRTPAVFKTKREAVAQADAQVTAFVRRESAGQGGAR